jgi:H/ACA ribonucleoprotein complex subunit 2
MQDSIKMEVDDSIVKDENIDAPEISYEEKLQFVNAISKPMASKKLTKKVYKCIKKGELLQSLLFNNTNILRQ